MKEKLDADKWLDIGLLEAEKADFFETEGGFLGLRYGETEYARVGIKRLLPFHSPHEFLCVVDHEQKEIGILRDLNTLSPSQAEMVQKEANKRYYCPDITQILSTKDKMGYLYMDVMLGGVQKTIAIKDMSRNIRFTEPQVLIFDVDGNRYTIPDVRKLDVKSYHKLELYLF